MLRAIIITAFLACASCVAVLVSVHAETRARERVLDERVIAFPRAGIALQPGATWHPFGSVSARESDSALCEPQVAGPGRFLVLLLPVGPAALSQAAEKAHAEFTSDPHAVAGSFREEEFVSARGLRGRHLSYQRRAQPARAPLPFSGAYPTCSPTARGVPWPSNTASGHRLTSARASASSAALTRCDRLPSPNPALERTSSGGNADPLCHTHTRQKPSLSFSPLGPSDFTYE